MSLFRKSVRLPDAAEALPGRSTPIPTATRHAVLGTPLAGPFPAGLETVLFGLGCFWGAERLFWHLPGVHTTSAVHA
jgi:peptide-methionine (S)-S-oxide reductase